MCLAKSSLILASALILTGVAHAATFIQTDGTFLAFNVELGTLDDGATDGTKFDVMAPAGGSFSQYISAESSGGVVSFSVDFLDNEIYTTYVRYRELSNNTPRIHITLDGGASTTSDIFVSPSTTFGWTHLNTGDITPSGSTPGLTQTVTLQAVSTKMDGSISAHIDAVAFVRRSAVNGGGFTVSDATIPQGALAIPEPSTALLLLSAPLLILRRRRS